MLLLQLNVTIPHFSPSSGSCIIAGIHDSNCLVATIDQRSPTCIEFTAHAPASQTEHMVSLGNMTVHDPHLCATFFSSALSSVAVCTFQARARVFFLVFYCNVGSAASATCGMFFGYLFTQCRSKSWLPREYYHVPKRILVLVKGKKTNGFCKWRRCLKVVAFFERAVVPSDFFVQPQYARISTKP